jgi:hypothetical protein
MKWVGLNAVIIKGSKGLNDDKNYIKYVEFCNSEKKNTGVASLLFYWGLTKQIRMQDVYNSVNVYVKVTGKLPSCVSGDIIKGALVGMVNKWNSLDAILKKGNNGLRDDPEYIAFAARCGGKPTLSKLCAEIKAEQDKKAAMTPAVKPVRAVRSPHP